MINVLSGLRKYLKNNSSAYNNLIRKEAVIGGRIFGRIPSNVSRSFFCLDENTWVFHEDTTLKNGSVKTNIIRYELQPDRIVKVINGNRYLLSHDEKQNFYKATKTYQKRVFSELYSV
ncbi:MAG TPA: hypothetical protein VMQ58_03020 [Candidatus Saccharimonadales bacterium]|jgi:hypothetical protein|nr:hypothetical protein [Candidatus Saccharimonadales bacterium]